MRSKIERFVKRHFANEYWKEFPLRRMFRISLLLGVLYFLYVAITTGNIWHALISSVQWTMIGFV
jgi:hypothetical protein